MYIIYVSRVVEITLTVMPVGGNSDIIFGLQSLSRTLICSLHLS